MPEPTVAQLKAIIADLQDENEDLKRNLANADNKAAAFEQKFADERKRHHKKILDGDFAQVAHSMGFPPASVVDVLNAVPTSGWSVNEQSAPEFRDKDGKVRYDVTPESWLAEQAKGRWDYVMKAVSAPPGGGSAGGFEGKNPWSKDGWNDTDQAKIYKANPAKAEQMAKAAGSYIGALPPDPKKPRY